MVGWSGTASHVFLVSAGALVLACLLLVSGASHVVGDDFDIQIEMTIAPEDHAEWELVVEKGQTVTIDVSADEGRVDFYFMDTGDYFDFLASREGTVGVEITYLPELSQIDSQHVDKSETVAIADIYYFVVANDNQFDVTLTGSIKGSFVEEGLLMALLIVFSVAGLVVAILLIYMFIVRRGQPVRTQPAGHMIEGRYSPPSVGAPHQPPPPRQKLGSMCSRCHFSLSEESSSCPRCGWSPKEGATD